VVVVEVRKKIEGSPKFNVLFLRFVRAQSFSSHNHRIIFLLSLPTTICNSCWEREVVSDTIDQ